MGSWLINFALREILTYAFGSQNYTSYARTKDLHHGALVDTGKLGFMPTESRWGTLTTNIAGVDQKWGLRDPNLKLKRGQNHSK